MGLYAEARNRKMWVFCKINIPYCGDFAIPKIIAIFAYILDK
jgi:hypothetical protein